MNLMDLLPSSGGVVPSGQTPAAPAPTLQTAPAPVPLTDTPVGGDPSYPVQPTPPGGPGAGKALDTPLPNEQSRFNNGEQGAASIRASRWDSWAAGWEQQSNKAAIGLPGADEPGALSRMAISAGIQNYSDKSGGPIMDADAANKMYPGRPEPYTAPVSQMVAQLEYNDRQRMAKIAAWKNSSGPTPFTDFAQGLIGGFADPLNAALMAAAGPVVGALGLGEATGAAKLATRFGENLGINAVTGAATYAAEKQEGGAPTVGGAVRGAVEGAVGGTLFGYGLDALSAGFKGALSRFRSESPDTQARVTKEVIAAMDKNTTPVLDSQNAVLEQRRVGVTQDGQNIQRITPPAEMPTQAFAAKDGSGNPAVFHDGLGPGTQLTSSGDVANNKVSNPEGTKPGHIGETTVNPEKLLNVDKNATADYESKDSFLKALEEKSSVDLKDLVGNEQSVQDVIKNLGDWAGHEDIPEDILQQAQEVAKAQGFEGYSLLRKADDGSPIDHVAHMFDENYPVTGQVSQANPEITPKLPTDPDMVSPQATQNPPGSVYSTPEIDKEVHDLKHGPALNSTPEYMDPYVKDIFDQAHAELTKLAETSDTAKEALEQLQRLNADSKQQGDMAKRLADCVAGGMS